MRFELLHPADQLVMIMDRIYRYGMTTTSGGNLSIKDENGDIWITPSGIDKGNLTREDVCQVKPDGTVIGPHKPSVELPFHTKIYEIRPDLKGILHAHPPTLVAFSLARKIPNLSLIPNATEVCGKVGMARYDVPGSAQLGDGLHDLRGKILGYAGEYRDQNRTDHDPYKSTAPSVGCAGLKRILDRVERRLHDPQSEEAVDMICACFRLVNQIRKRREFIT